MSSTYHGKCHCGGIAVVFETGIAPGEAEVRECQCSFCRIHGARAASDPSGKLSFTETTPGALNRYRFGLRTADFLVCNGCGAYMGCILTADDGAWGIVNINTLDARTRFTQPPTPFDYDTEDTAGRIARRRQKWTPAVINT